MNLKTENRIAMGTIAFIYLTFMVVKTFFFLDHSFTWHIVTSLLGLLFIFVFGYIARAIDIYLDKIYPFEKNPFKRIALQFLITSMALILIRLVSYLLLYRYITFNFNREMIVATSAINMFMVLSVILSIFGYHFFIRWKQEKILAAELEKEKAMVQYDNLKNQLNPHFLFNSLTSLNSLIFDNPQLASDFLQQLSKVYRYVLDNKEKNLVSVQTEINFVKHYISLLKARFENGLEVHFSVDENALQKAVVPVTLQILIENAVKHNVTNAGHPLHIQIRNEGDYLVIENNLQHKNVMEVSNGQGLNNLKNLYRYLSPLEIQVIHNQVSFIVKIPLMEI